MNLSFYVAEWALISVAIHHHNLVLSSIEYNAKILLNLKSVIHQFVRSVLFDKPEVKISIVCTNIKEIISHSFESLSFLILNYLSLWLEFWLYFWLHWCWLIWFHRIRFGWVLLQSVYTFNVKHIEIINVLSVDKFLRIDILSVSKESLSCE